ncbi:MAG: hypothetical protein ISS45_02290 [Candidatus Omnitrophica bacterium]|nr:hypothetical protein [Candidatus Omnitrophota bacterium]
MNKKRIFKNRNKGHSLLAWTLTFTAILSVLGVIQVSFKRLVSVKVEQTADYALWGNWGEDPISEPPEQTSRIKNTTTPIGPNRSFVNERNDATITAALDAENNDKRVSSGVEQGSEVLLNLFDFD